MIRGEKQLLITAQRVLKLNLAIVEARSYDTPPSKCVDSGPECERDTLLEQIRDYDACVNPDRKGPWFFTAKGNRFWREDPRPQDVHLEDIAHNLSLLCRYCGNVSTHYSVAQHSVLVSRVVRPEAALAGLLHDAAEAWFGDIISPVKKEFEWFEKAEAAAMRAVCLRFGVDHADERMWLEVKRGDEVLKSTEFRDLACSQARLGELSEPAMPERIRPWSASGARHEFLLAFRKLTA